MVDPLFFTKKRVVGSFLREVNVGISYAPTPLAIITWNITIDDGVTHGHVQQSAHAVLDSRAPCHYVERRRFRRRGRNTDKSRRYVDEVMRQVWAQTTDARDNAYDAGPPNQLPEHEPCSNGQDACDDWVTGHSRPQIMCRRRLTQMMMMMAAYLHLTWLTSPAMMRITHLKSIR